MARPILDIDHEYKHLRMSALKNAIEIAPLVNETTLGPDVLNSFPGNGVGANGSNGSITVDVHPQSLQKKLDSPPVQQEESENGLFTFEKFIHECELRQREAADMMFKSKISKMVAKRADMMTKFWHQQEIEYERRSQERRNREMEILQKWALSDKLAKLEQEKLDEENKAHSERMRQVLEKQLESTKLFEKLNSNHSIICTLYQEVTNITSSDDETFMKVHFYESSLSSLLSSMNLIMENCKSGAITAEDVHKSSALIVKMCELKITIANEYTKSIKLLEESAKEKKESTEVVNKAENVNKSSVEKIGSNVLSNEKPQINTSRFCSENSLRAYIELKEYLGSYELSYKELLEDNTLKKFRFDCQKAINTPVNAISSVSGAHLKDKYEKLYKLLAGDKVKVGDSLVSCSQHPQAKAYCINLLARKIVRQGEHLVSSNPEAAFPIASLTVALWAKFPELGKLVCAHFQKDCPYLIPLMMPHCEGQTDEEYYKSRGYHYGDDGSIEKQDKFLKRMSGIFRLAAAIWVCKMPYTVNCPHPQGLSYAWRWMAAFINLDPEADITATLLYDFLSVCGSDFFKYYKGQFVKVLQYLLTEYREKIDKIDEGGPKTRLEVFLQNITKDGRIPVPVGLLPERIW